MAAGKSAAEAEAARLAEEELKRQERLAKGTGGGGRGTVRRGAGPSRGRAPRLHTRTPGRLDGTPADLGKSGRALLTSQTSALGMVKLKLKGRKFINDVLGKTALARAKRRVVIARKLEQVRLQRPRLRAVNVSVCTEFSLMMTILMLLLLDCGQPPHYECATCIRTFALREDLKAHHAKPCNPAESVLVSLSTDLADTPEEVTVVRDLQQRNAEVIQAFLDAEAAKVEAERRAREEEARAKAEAEAKRLAEEKAAAAAALVPNEEEDIDAFLGDD